MAGLDDPEKASSLDEQQNGRLDESLELSQLRGAAGAAPDEGSLDEQQNGRLDELRELGRLRGMMQAEPGDRPLDVPVEPDTDKPDGALDERDSGRLDEW